MLLKNKILFSEDGGAGTGGTGGQGGSSGEGSGGSEQQPKTYSEEQFKEVVKQRDEVKGKLTSLQTSLDEVNAKLKTIEDDKLKAAGKTDELLTSKTQEVETLKGQLAELTEQKNAETEEKNKVIKRVRKDMLDQLPDEHKKIAEKMDDIDLLADYVKLNGKDKQNIDGSKGGVSISEIAQKSWGEMTMAEKQELKDKNPTLYKQKLESRNKPKT